MTSTLDPYDEVLYPNYCYPQTHPDRLASLATLFGMKPAPLHSCRVLELACGDGANLLPMAYALPTSEFLGVDRAAKPIAQGSETIAELGLNNLRLEQLDIMELDERYGGFDYIIAHGLYSWVPQQVQNRIMEICRARLNPHGVAYISYNAYPGCHLRAISRDILLYHTRAIDDPIQRIRQSRAITKWVAEAQSENNGYALLLRELADGMAKRNDAVILHDDLSSVNSPLYFYEFVTRAAKHGLQFLSESEYFYTPDRRFSAEVTAQLNAFEDDIINKEQYLDFLEGRSFRQTLLCHHEVKLERKLKPALIKQFLIRADAKPLSSNPDLISTTAETFTGPKESSLTTSLPLAKAAIWFLGDLYPHSITFNGLLQKTSELLKSNPDSDSAQSLADLILQAYGAGVVNLHIYQPEFTLDPGERPLASSLARFQARKGPMVTSLFGNSVKFEDDVGRQLITLLDGTRNRAALQEEILKLVADKVTPDERDKVSETVAEKMDEKLRDLAGLGFLLE